MARRWRGEGEERAKRWHIGGDKSIREMKVIIVASSKSHADDKSHGGGIAVVFRHSTGRANKRTQTKTGRVIKAQVYTKLSDLVTHTGHAQQDEEHEILKAANDRNVVEYW